MVKDRVGGHRNTTSSFVYALQGSSSYLAHMVEYSEYLYLLIIVWERKVQLAEL